MSNQRDAFMARGYQMHARAPDAESIVVEQFAERDPIAAVRALSHGLSHQTTGAQLSALRLLAEGLVRRDPSLAAEIARDLGDLGATP
jgi:hypothetical protein